MLIENLITNNMKMTLNFSQFYDNWPESRKEQFSYGALRAIFDYLEQYEEDAGEEIEYDPIAICCEYTEYETALEGAKEYGFEPDEEDSEEKQEEAALEYLEERTTVLPCGSGGIVIAQF